MTVGLGVLEGGWEYVYMAYAVTWIVIIGYSASIWSRGRGGPHD